MGKLQTPVSGLAAVEDIVLYRIVSDGLEGSVPVPGSGEYVVWSGMRPATQNVYVPAKVNWTNSLCFGRLKQGAHFLYCCLRVCPPSPTLSLSFLHFLTLSLSLSLFHSDSYSYSSSSLYLRVRYG